MNDAIGIKAVADAAGVSPATVSNVVTGKRPVSAATRERVEAAIERLGYTPHPGAQSMRSKRTGVAALIVPTLANPFYPLVAAGMHDVLVPRDIMLTVTEADGSSRASHVLRKLLSRRSDGIVAAPFGLTPADVGLLRASGVPFVTLGAPIMGSGGDRVHTADVDGAREVTAHLIGRGYRTIAYIGGPETAVPTRERLEGYLAARDAAGIPHDPQRIVFGDFTREAGRAAAAALLDSGNPPRAIVAGNDLIAVGVIDAARERGIQVPGELAVTGYDDIDAASLVSPALTTVENPAREIGRVSAQLILDRLDGTVDAARTIALAHRLVVRESS